MGQQLWKPNLIYHYYYLASVQSFRYVSSSVIGKDCRFYAKKTNKQTKTNAEQTMIQGCKKINNVFRAAYIIVYHPVLRHQKIFLNPSVDSAPWTVPLFCQSIFIVVKQRKMLFAHAQFINMILSFNIKNNQG